MFSNTELIIDNVQRLMTMESLQAKIESEISSIKRGLESGREEVTLMTVMMIMMMMMMIVIVMTVMTQVTRRLTEVATTAGDAGSEQNRLMDTFKQHFASLGRYV